MTEPISRTQLEGWMDRLNDIAAEMQGVHAPEWSVGDRGLSRELRIIATSVANAGEGLECVLECPACAEEICA